MIGSSLEHLPWDIKGWCNFHEFPQGTMVECNQTRPPGAYGSPLMLMVIEMLLCLLFLPKYCSHQVICGILSVGGKPWCVNMVYQVQREGSFATEHQENRV